MESFQAPRYKDVDKLPESEWQNGRRPTVVMLILNTRSGNDKLLLVKSKHGPSWVAPQGGIKREDHNLYEAVRREGWEELQLPETYIMRSKVQVLGEFLNHIPKERGTGLT